MSQAPTQASKPIVVKPINLNVSKEVYNTLRSFVESSTRPVYSHNVGILRGEVAIFEKPGKWRLAIEPLRRVAVLTAPRVYIEFAIEPTCYRVAFNDQQFCVNTREAKEYDIVPKDEIPYARPINLSKIIDKFLLYMDVAVEALSGE
jgi:hypothetical protein